ncbi:polysaccharide biosynthesis tyrosine autokinase [uncultured Ilyobacter sp.]|uniref:polysaccharide biosynthesis tyrosine autokinase n=1 Tax=uncultured Ilyobacter sp. TaxID=544433 RepID=UPI0029F4BB2C|nr:polysaccharide biosynthesis tyrosine autokinase [uncultured Ilyobacter sp.]
MIMETDQNNYNNTYSNPNIENKEKSLMELFFILVRKKNLIILITLLSITLGIAYVQFLNQDVYKAEVTLMVSSRGVYASDRPDDSEIATNQQLASSYTELAKSKNLAKNVIRELDLDIEPEDMRKFIKVTPIKETEFIKISYTDKDPQKATLIVNEISDEFITKIREIMYFDNLRIIEAAEVPEKPAGFGRVLIIEIFAVFGIIFGIFTAFINEFFFSNIINPEVLRKIMMCDVLTNIPDFKHLKLKRGKDKSNLFFKEGQQNQVTEAFRVLRTNIHFIESKKNNILLTTSSVPNEGKSFVAANYAMSEAAIGKKVLLMDLDIRKPRAHVNFGLNYRSGMEEVLLGKKSASEVIVKIEKNLDLIPSKHLNNNVTELIFGNVIEKTLKELGSQYDLIIIDTPPLTVATDAAILSKYSDGVIFVNGYDMTTHKDLLHAKKILSNAGANIYGMVVNKVKKDGYQHGNYGYYNHNYKHYENYIKTK